MTDKPSGLKILWNILSGKHPLENPDGTVTTRHGRRIIPYRITVNHQGAVGSNLPDVLAQPRMKELIAQMQPLAESRTAKDKFALDETTGDFFLQSDVRKYGAAKAKPLGQIDVAKIAPFPRLTLLCKCGILLPFLQSTLPAEDFPRDQPRYAQQGRYPRAPRRAGDDRHWRPVG
jgi:hypothetical protein